jgi:hypothetical protein
MTTLVTSIAGCIGSHMSCHSELLAVDVLLNMWSGSESIAHGAREDGIAIFPIVLRVVSNADTDAVLGFIHRARRCKRIYQPRQGAGQRADRKDKAEPH